MAILFVSWAWHMTCLVNALHLECCVTTGVPVVRSLMAKRRQSVCISFSPLPESAGRLDPGPALSGPNGEAML